MIKDGYLFNGGTSFTHELVQSFVERLLILNIKLITAAHATATPAVVTIVAGMLRHSVINVVKMKVAGTIYPCVVVML